MVFLYSLGELLSGRKSHHYFIILAVSCAATLMNSYGLKYWLYMWDAVTMPRPFISEWQSAIDSIVRQVYFWDASFFVGLVAFTIILLFFQKKKESTSILILGATAVVGFKQIRHIVFFALSFGAFAPKMISDSISALSDKHEFLDKLLKSKKILIFLLIVIALDSSLFFYLNFLSGTPFKLKVESSKESSGCFYPVAAIDYMKQKGLKGNILPHFEWGEYLIWKFYPDSKVAMDGRYETVYSEQLSKSYFDFILGNDNWRSFLNAYNHEIIMIRPDSRTRQLLSKEKNWTEIYVDNDCAILVKK